MNETLATAQPGRREAAAGYDDTQATHDVHVLVTGLAARNAVQVAASAREIVARTGRLLRRATMSSATMIEGRHGIPAAEGDGDGTVVTVGHDPGGLGELVRITTCFAAELSELVDVVGGRLVTGRRPGPTPGGDRR